MGAVVYHTSRHHRGIFKFRTLGLVSNTSVKDLKGKVVLCRRKRSREKDREKEPEGEIVWGKEEETKEEERSGREGSESTMKACVSYQRIRDFVVLPPFFRLPLLSTSLPLPLPIPFLLFPPVAVVVASLSLFAFTPMVYEDSLIVCKFAHNERTRTCTYTEGRNVERR